MIKKLATRIGIFAAGVVLSLFPLLIFQLHFKLSSKYVQKMPAVEYRNMKHRDVIQDLANKSRKPITFWICESLADKPVTVSFPKGEEMNKILRRLCVPENCSLQLAHGKDLLVEIPSFDCENSRSSQIHIKSKN